MHYVRGSGYSKHFLVVHYTYYHMQCLNALVGRIHVYHVVHYTNISTLLLLLTVPMQDQLQFDSTGIGKNGMNRQLLNTMWRIGR